MIEDDIIKLIKEAPWLSPDEREFWIGLVPNLEDKEKDEILEMFKTNLENYKKLKK